MITIPTTELIGGLTDVLPQITDDKGSLAGVRIDWDGDALNFTTYDVHSGATVTWVPGEGAEGDPEEGPGGEAVDDDINWGGDDAPWSVWIWLPQAKEILKLFKLPAKLWRFPVTVKCSPTGDRLIIEREDGPKAGRLLMLNTSNDTLRHIPDVRAIQQQITNDAEDDGVSTARWHASFAPHRLGAFGSVRLYGGLTLWFGQEDAPVGVTVGRRFAGFVYPTNAKNVRPYNLLRDGAGVVVTREPAGPRPADEDGQDD